MATIEEIRAQFPQYDDLSDGDLLMGLHRKYYSDIHPRTFLNGIEGAKNAHATIRNPELRDYWRENVSKPIAGENEEQTSSRLAGSAEGPVGDPGGRAGSAARSAFQGMTFGFGDEIVARGASLLSDNTYEEELQAERDRLDLGRDQNPVASTGAEIAGALAVPGLAFTKGSTPLRTGLRAGATAGAEGAVYGFGAGEDGFTDRAKNAAGTGASAAALGMAGSLGIDRVGRAFQNAAARRATRKAGRSAPSLDDIRAEARGIYKQADNVSGLPSDDFRQTQSALAGRLDDLGMDADLTPKSSAVASRIADTANDAGPEGLRWRDVEKLRRKAGIASQEQVPAERMLAGNMIEALDDYIAKVDPELAPEVGKAREMWSRLLKSDEIEAAIARASRQASGFPNGLKIEFRKILNNPKKAGRFSQQERAAMEAVIDGTPLGRALSFMGKFGFDLSSSGASNNFLGGSIGGAAGAAVGSAFGAPTLGALAVPAAGTAARKGSDILARRQADDFLKLIASGGAETLNQIPQETLDRLMQASRVGGRAALPALTEIPGLLSQ